MGIQIASHIGVLQVWGQFRHNMIDAFPVIKRIAAIASSISVIFAIILNAV
jgi:hypothetical protein